MNIKLFIAITVLCTPAFASKTQWLRDSIFKKDRPNIHEVQLALKSGQVDVTNLRDGHISLLHDALRQKWVPAAIALVIHGVDVKLKSSRGITALHQAAWLGEINLIEMLLENGADVNSLDIEGRSPLWHAMAYDEVETAKMLIRAGADIDSDNIANHPFNDGSPVFELMKHEIATKNE